MRLHRTLSNLFSCCPSRLTCGRISRSSSSRASSTPQPRRCRHLRLPRRPTILLSRWEAMCTIDWFESNCWKAGTIWGTRVGESLRSSFHSQRLLRGGEQGHAFLTMLCLSRHPTLAPRHRCSSTRPRRLPSPSPHHRRRHSTCLHPAHMEALAVHSMAAVPPLEADPPLSRGPQATAARTQQAR